jgi:hypothetical protein
MLYFWLGAITAQNFSMLKLIAFCLSCIFVVIWY